MKRTYMHILRTSLLCMLVAMLGATLLLAANAGISAGRSFQTSPSMARGSAAWGASAAWGVSAHLGPAYGSGWEAASRFGGVGQLESCV